MALTREKKKETIKKLEETIIKQKSIVFVDFSKVSTQNLFSLRKKLKEFGCLLKVGKKTLVRIAFGRSGLSFWDEIKKNIPGQLALVFGTEDEIAPARISNQFAKLNENFKILGGIFEKKFIDKAKVLELASIPPRNELLSRLAGSLASPVSNLARLLNKIKEQKEKYN